MNHILVFDRAVRLGAYVSRYVGPFDTAEEAREWYEEAKLTFAHDLPNVTLDTIMDKDS